CEALHLAASTNYLVRIPSGARTGNRRPGVSSLTRAALMEVVVLDNAPVLRWAGIGLGALAALALLALAGVYIASEAVILNHYPLPTSALRASTDAQAIVRGQHFAYVYGCADCHTHSLRGTFIPDFGIASRNLPKLATTYSDADFDRAVRHG